MLKKLKEYFSGEETLENSVPASLIHDKSGKLADSDLHIAAAVLLVQAASSDESIVEEEAEAICSVIEKNFGIPDIEIPELIETAVAARRDKGKLDAFIELINQRFESAQKKRLLAMVWKVVLADHKVEKLEERMVIQIRNRLKLTQADGEEARVMAEADSV